MARVIKAGDGNLPGENALAPRRSPARIGQSGRPVIEKVVFRAQQEAADRLAAAEEKREKILLEGRQKAHQAREEAQVGGAEEAFAEAAKEAILAFKHRAERYAEAASDIEILALEVVKKILGQSPALSSEQINAVLHAGLMRLRARRRLRIQVPKTRLEALKNERTLLIAALEKEPDLLLEAQADVNPGFARVVTEAGAALCAESAALDLLSEALAVDESAASAAATFDAPPSPAEATTNSAELSSADRDAPASPPSSAPAEAAEAEAIAQRSSIRKSRNSAKSLPARTQSRAAKPLPPVQPAEKSAHSAPARDGARRVRPLVPSGPAPSERVRRLTHATEALGAPQTNSRGRVEPLAAPPRARPLQAGPSEQRGSKPEQEGQEPKDVSFQDEESFADSDLDLFADEALGD